jgi:hypothetical protein
MEALPLIKFLLKPKPGRINAINSPFEQENFSLITARSWVARNKATIDNGVLFFHDDFRMRIMQRFQREELSQNADKAFETMVDLQRSDGQHANGSFAVWAGRHSGQKPYGGVGPQNRVMQMTRRFGKNGK